jgi:integrase
LCGELIDEWKETLINRSAKDDKSRLKLHVRPHLANLRPDEVTLPVVMQWIDAQRAIKLPATGKRGRERSRTSTDGRLSDTTIRHSLNLLSRFFAWCVERGHAQLNPVRLIPTGKRPQQTAKDEMRPWINDDKTVRDVMNALAPPFREMFYLGNRSGLRPGEQRGLRMSDLEYLDDGVTRVRYSDDGPLKEDRRRTGTVKWVPAADDMAVVLGEWLAKRRAEDAKPEDLVFMPELSRGALKQHCEEAWREAADALALKLDYYEATRHSFVSRNLAAGASLDEVSAAIGHSSPVVTRRDYDHFVRKTFSAGLRAGIGASINRAAAVTPMRAKGPG